MLLWLRLVKDARMDEDWRKWWFESLWYPSQVEMLRRLDVILGRGEVTYKHCNTAKLAARGCRKQFASVVFVTSDLVRASLPSDGCYRERWDKRVMRDWHVNSEGVSEILQRMNKFLWSEIEAIQITTDAIGADSSDEGSVFYLRMHKIACLILFEYLSTYLMETLNMTSGSRSVSSIISEFEGFSLFASSSGKVFSLQRTSRHRLHEIKRNLRVLACLPDRLLLFLGIARRAERLLVGGERSILTDHQKAKAKECEEAMARRRGVHLRGPAGTGKTFMALHMMLRELEKDRSCSVLFFLRSEGFVYFIAQWMSSMASWRLVDEGLFQRIFFCFRGKRGWDGPFWMTEGEGELRRQQRNAESLLEKASEYKYVVIDAAHHVFCDEEATEYMKTMKYDKATMMLMSDSSQAEVTSISYPEDLQDVILTEVVRNSERTMTASLLFQRGISTAQVSCTYSVHGRPVRPYVFSPSSEDKRSSQAREYVHHVVRAMIEAMGEFRENLDRKMAILVDEKLVREGLRQILEDHLNQYRLFRSRFKLIAAADAWRTNETGNEESERERVIFDSVGNFDGMESKIVIAVGLDGEENNADMNLHRSLLYRAITRALKEGMVMIVNHRVKGGLLSFLDALVYEDLNFVYIEWEKMKIDESPWEHLEVRQQKVGLPPKKDFKDQLTGEASEHKGTIKGEKKFTLTSRIESFWAWILGLVARVWQVYNSKRIQPTFRSVQIVQSVWDTRRYERGTAAPAFLPYRPEYQEGAGAGIDLTHPDLRPFTNIHSYELQSGSEIILQSGDACTFELQSGNACIYELQSGNACIYELQGPKDEDIANAESPDANSFAESTSRRLVTRRPGESSAVAEIDWSSKDSPHTPRCPYRFLFVPVRDPDRPLDLRDEYNRIHAIMSATDVNQLFATFAPTWSNIAKSLLSHQPMILHFACHSDQNAVQLFQRDVQPE
eukprot:768123-Hanusia_phi.AAC.1